MPSYKGMMFVGKTTAAHSKRMSAIRSRENRTTELRVLALLKANKLSGWRRHLAMVGCPDFAFPAQRVAVFIDGCFWHGCPKCQKLPRSNIEFWEKKIATNRARDREVNAQLKSKGWRVIRVWEHSLKNESRVLARLRSSLETPECSELSTDQLR